MFYATLILLKIVVVVLNIIIVVFETWFPTICDYITNVKELVKVPK